MCGRFFFEGDLDEVIERFNIHINNATQYRKGEIYPSYEFPVIYKKEENRIELFKWGFTAPYLRNLVINARGETVDSKPMFKRALIEGRCIIPANGYFEWQSDGNIKIKHKISLVNQKLFSMAGLYSKLIDKNGEVFTGFTIITKEAIPSLKKIHHRMPVILSSEKEDLWISEANDHTPINILRSDMIKDDDIYIEIV
ncbi:SOS response-associated peptidase [Alkaliphilus peptidifermentans]|uniref:Abasic site processing protein n=1 Tax=Alkaliphilus peptidifermentans DSM 18978 TaxID=1120976 RepID=A0A1G5K0D3_9FIRM|nr:SOS response-associated peptidase [Alkaliphilus peptidifermentans]SCY93631.1 Putative SOS response-associated peptidase YedK [Alkaliphilus peptidifermentans DSM 18978]